jgi:hypothetical protein
MTTMTQTLTVSIDNTHHQDMGDGSVESNEPSFMFSSEEKLGKGGFSKFTFLRFIMLKF